MEPRLIDLGPVPVRTLFNKLIELSLVPSYNNTSCCDIIELKTEDARREVTCSLGPTPLSDLVSLFIMPKVSFTYLPREAAFHGSIYMM